MTFMLPETEDRSLEDIELHFSDNKRSIFSTHIQKNPSKDTELNTKSNDLQQSNGTETIESFETDGKTSYKQRF